MEYVNAVILGIIQGIAEFLPISSSGHLVIADALLREFGNTSAPKESATMEIALHFGTLLSILLVYRRDLVKLLSDRRLMLMIVLATVPVGLVGIFLKDYVNAAFGNPLLAGCALIVTAGFLLAGRSLQKPAPASDSISARTAVTVGVFQAVAVIPGISRSGSTIAAGMGCGLSRENAARFSFFIAIPAIGGAAVMQLKDLMTGDAVLSGDPGALALGTVTAFVVGVVSLRWLIRLVVADRLHWFAAYCLVAGLLTIVWQLT